MSVSGNASTDGFLFLMQRPRWLALSVALFLMATCPVALVGVEKNPNFLKEVGGTIKHAGQILDSVDMDLKNEHYDTIQPQLKEYKSLLDAASDDAKDYLEEHKNKVPRQFKDGEINLRKQLRLMEDLRRIMPFALRPDLDAAKASAIKLRRQFLGELFVVNPNPKPPQFDQQKRNP